MAPNSPPDDGQQHGIKWHHKLLTSTWHTRQYHGLHTSTYPPSSASMVSGGSIDHEQNMACHGTGQEYQHCIWGNMCHRHQHDTQGQPSPRTSTLFQAIAQTTYIYIAFGGEMDNGHQCDP